MPRDSGGSESLPQAPAVDGTVASAAWINAQLGDLAAEVTDSLSRSGKGGLLSPLKFLDGSVSLPAITFTSEPASGLYRVAANILALVIAGAEKLRATLTGVAVTGTVAASGDVVADSGGANSGTIGSNVLRFGGAASGEAIGAKRTSGGNQCGLDFYTNSTIRMSITNGGAVTGLPAPAGATDAATKGYVDGGSQSGFIAAISCSSAGNLITAKGSVTGTCSRQAEGVYQVNVTGLTSSGIVMATPNAPNGDYSIAVSIGAGAAYVWTVQASAPIDVAFSFVVLAL